MRRAALVTEPWREREPELIAAARTLFVKHPIERVTLDMLGQVSGIERTWVHRWGSRADLYRRASLAWLTPLDDALAATISTNKGVLQHIRGLAAVLVAAFEREEHRALMHVLIRDAEVMPWLREAYERRIETLATKIERGVARAGRTLGVQLGVPRAAVLNYLHDLETTFAIRPIKPGLFNVVRDPAKALARINDDLHGAVVVIDGAARDDAWTPETPAA